MNREELAVLLGWIVGLACVTVAMFGAAHLGYWLAGVTDPMTLAELIAWPVAILGILLSIVVGVMIYYKASSESQSQSQSQSANRYTIPARIAWSSLFWLIWSIVAPLAAAFLTIKYTGGK